MDTPTLIRHLAADLAPQPVPSPLPNRLLFFALAGAGLAVFAVVVWLGPRPDLVAMLGSARGFAKFALALGLAASAGTVALQLVEPGRSPPWLVLAAGIVVGVLAMGWGALAGGAGGKIPVGCLVAIPALAVAPLAGVLAALRAGAPERPALAGAAAGVLAGALAAFAYSVTCPLDLGAVVALWYPLTIAGVTASGAAIGRLVLAW